MKMVFPAAGGSDTVLLETLRRLIHELPVRHRSRLQVIGEQVDHWFHLRNETLRQAEATIADLRLENTFLRFDRDVTRRELDDWRQSESA